MFQLALSTAGIPARLSPVPTMSPRKQGEGEQEGERGQAGTPHPTHSPSTIVAQGGTGVALPRQLLLWDWLVGRGG